MKITKTKLKEIIKQSIQEEKEYDKYFRGMLAKYGVESPADLSDEEKSKFFSDVDKGWDVKNEGNVLSVSNKLVDESNTIQKIFRKIGWGGDDWTPQDYARQIKNLSDETLKIWYNSSKSNKGIPNTPLAFQQKLTKIEMSKRGLLNAKNEGNAFGAAVTAAKEKGEDEFEVDGKTYPVKESMNESRLKPGTKLRYEKNNFVIDYVVDKEYKGRDGFTKYILKVVKSNYPKKIKVGSTEEYEDSKLTGLIRNRVMNFIKNESVTKSLKEDFIPGVGQIDDHELKKMLLKNPKVTTILSPKELEFMKNPKTDVIMHQSKRFNIIVTDGKMEFEIDNKAGKVVKPLTKARKEIADYYSTNESVISEVTLRKGAKIRLNIENHDVTYKLIDTKYWTTSYQGGFTARWEVIRSTHPKVKVGTIEEMHPNTVKKLLKSGIATIVTESNESINETIKGTKNESVNEGKKVFKVNPPIGKVKYSISSHDGVKKHNDGSDFYDIKIFKNKVDLEKGIKKYTSNGFVKESKDFTSIREVIRGIILTESKYDLMFGKLGNGITVSNRKVSDPSTKDYKKVAHISTDGKIQWYDKDAQRDSKVRREVEKHAKKMNESDCGCGNTTISEGNAFGAAVTAAKKAGQKEFEFNGKTYKVKKGSYEKNEEAKKESVNESVSVFDERYYGKKGIIIMIDDGGKKVSAIFKDKRNADKYNRNKPEDVKKLLDLAKKTPYPKAIDESVNESATRTAMEIGALTGMNKDFIQKFVDANELDIEKVFQYVKRGKLKDRMDFVTALSGKPNNPIQKKLITMFKESVTEAFKHIIHVDTPTQVVSKPVAAQIMALAKKGIRSNEIGLEMGFTGNTKLAVDTFQKVKNRIYFELDKRESVVTEGKHDSDLDKVEAAVKNASSFMGVGAELKKAGIKYDFSTSMIPMYRIKVVGNTIGIANKKYVAGAEREVKDIAIGLLEGSTGRSLKVENLSPDIAKHMIGIYKGFEKVENDGVMIYDSPKNAEKAAEYLNKKKIAASSDGKYLYIESKV